MTFCIIGQAIFSILLETTATLVDEAMGDGDRESGSSHDVTE